MQLEKSEKEIERRLSVRNNWVKAIHTFLQRSAMPEKTSQSSYDQGVYLASHQPQGGWSPVRAYHIEKSLIVPVCIGRRLAMRITCSGLQNRASDIAVMGACLTEGSSMFDVVGAGGKTRVCVCPFPARRPRQTASPNRDSSTYSSI